MSFFLAAFTSVSNSSLKTLKKMDAVILHWWVNLALTEENCILCWGHKKVGNITQDSSIIVQWLKENVDTFCEYTLWGPLTCTCTKPPPGPERFWGEYSFILMIKCIQFLLFPAFVLTQDRRIKQKEITFKYGCVINSFNKYIYCVNNAITILHHFHHWQFSRSEQFHYIENGNNH